MSGQYIGAKTLGCGRQNLPRRNVQGLLRGGAGPNRHPSFVGGVDLAFGKKRDDIATPPAEIVATRSGN
jgi:hypothetical protein